MNTNESMFLDCGDNQRDNLFQGLVEGNMVVGVQMQSVPNLPEDSGKSTLDATEICKVADTAYARNSILPKHRALLFTSHSCW